MRVRNHIKSAVGKLSQHNLSHDFLLSHDFGQLLPCLCLPLLPRDKMRINVRAFSRVSPMIFPTYGYCNLVTNFHTVQYSQLWRDFDSFVTGLRAVGNSVIHFPVISSSALNELFYRDILYYEGDADSENHELTIVDGDTTKYAFFSLTGRYVRKLLHCLGYPVPTTIYSTSSFPTTQLRYYSALPFVALLKIYYDFYASRQFATNSAIKELLNRIYSGNVVNGTDYIGVTGPNGANFGSIQHLYSYISQLRVLFPSDFFTSAQSYPNLVGGDSPVLIPNGISSSDPFYQEEYLTQSEQSNFYTSSVVSNLVKQSNPMHRLLDNFENLIRRYNLVGSREIDRIRASFGIRPSVQRNQYSTFVGGFNTELNIQDVTSTSAEPTVDNYLGSYAGKGIMADQSSFELSSDDFGICLGLSFLKVNPIYMSGLSREVLKTRFTSFYNPDFDHGYAQAIAFGELTSQSSSIPDLERIFGYQNAYDEYRHCISRAVGDFMDTDLLPFSFARDKVGSVAQTNNVIYQDSVFDSNVTSSPSSQDIYNEFQRIFVDGSGRDHFYLYYGFNIDSLRPVRTSSESFDLGVGDVSTSNNPVI